MWFDVVVVVVVVGNCIHIGLVMRLILQIRVTHEFTFFMTTRVVAFVRDIGIRRQL